MDSQTYMNVERL